MKALLSRHRDVLIDVGGILALRAFCYFASLTQS
jgi:hypothetical protein